MLYATKITALVNGELKEFMGPNVPGVSMKDAQQYCERNSLGYCTVIGQLIAEIPVKNNTPDFSNRIDYDDLN